MLCRFSYFPIKRKIFNFQFSRKNRLFSTYIIFVCHNSQIFIIIFKILILGFKKNSHKETAKVICSKEALERSAQSLLRILLHQVVSSLSLIFECNKS